MLDPLAVLFSKLELPPIAINDLIREGSIGVVRAGLLKQVISPAVLHGTLSFHSRRTIV